MRYSSLRETTFDQYTASRIRLVTSELQAIPSCAIDGTVPLSHAGQLIAEHIGSKDRECVVVLHLDTHDRVTDIELAAVGTLDEVLIHPREVFKAAIVNNAAAIVIGHNHPSGDLAPSRPDHTLSRQLQAIGDQLGIPVKGFYIVHGAESQSLEVK